MAAVATVVATQFATPNGNEWARVAVGTAPEYVSDPGLLRSRRSLPYVYMSGLVDNDEEVHGGNGVAVGGIASTREDLGGGTYGTLEADGAAEE
uniref:Uncharacterized protein n=1 Tax=Talaromyces marneffei PM1 TaxID=1077442 RepID=A0A093UZ01_TALMA